MLSEKFVRAIKLASIEGKKQYQFANRFGVRPEILSKFIHGYLKPKLNDPRLIGIGADLGLMPGEVFVSEGMPDGEAA